MKQFKRSILIQWISLFFSQETLAEEMIKKDFNSDGFPDILTHHYEGGSDFGGKFITLVDGKRLC